MAAATDDPSIEEEQQPPIIDQTIGARPIVPSAPADAPPRVLPDPATTDPNLLAPRPERVAPQPPGTLLTPPPRVAPEPPLQLTGDRQQNQVARAFRSQQDYQNRLSRFDAATMYDKQQQVLRQQREQDAQARATAGQTYDAQEAEKNVVNREQRNTLKSQGVETQENPDTGLVEPVRDEKGAIQFAKDKSPEDKQLATDTELHAAGANAMGQNVYEAARNIRNTIQDVTANGARLAKLQQDLANFDKNNPAINEQQPGGGWLGSQFRAGPSDTAQALQKQKSNLKAQVDDLTKKGYPVIDPKTGDVSEALKSLSLDTEVGNRYASAREAHTTASAEREAWLKVSPKDGGDIQQLIADRTNDVLAAGGDPSKDPVLSAIDDRRKELGIPAPSPEEQALKADPVYGPAVAKAREQLANGQAQMAPLQTRANKLLSRLESVVGFQTNPVTADQGDPDARLGVLRAFTDHITDPAQKGKVNTLLTALEPTLAQLRQSKAALQPVVNAHAALQDQWKKKYDADNAPAAESQPQPGVNASTGPAAPPGSGRAPQQPTAGPVNPQDFETKLSPEDETKFQEWKSKVAPNDSGNDYDLRGAFKAGVTPDVQTGHLPDTFKKPNHPTFSDQSVYAKARPDLAGHWEGEKFVPPKLNDSDPKKWSDLERQVAGLPAKAGTPHANVLDLFNYKVATSGISAVQGLFRMLSGIASDDQKRMVTDGTVDALEKYKRETLPKYYGVSPEDEKTTAGKVTGAAANVFDMAPGPAVMISKMASAAYANGYDQSVAKQKESGETDEKKIADSAHKTAAMNVAKMAPVLAAYALGGKIAGKAAELIAPTAGPLVRGVIGGATSTAANMAVSGGTRAVEGQPIAGDLEQNLTDAFFGATGGMHEAFGGPKTGPTATKPTPEAAHAEINSLQPSEHMAPEQVEQTQHALRALVKISQGEPMAALTTAERLALFKSPTPDGAPRVEMIRGEDGKQKPVISDATLARVKNISPTTAQLLPQDEASQRQAILAPQVEKTDPGTGKQIDLSGMGKGVTDNLYDALWAKLQKSDLTEGGKPSGLLQRARDEMQAGTITDQRELRDWAQSGGQQSPVAKRVVLLSKVLQRNGVDGETARGFASKFVADRGADEPAYDQRDAIKEAFAGAGGKFTETGEPDPAVDQANQAVREKFQSVELRAGAYGKGSGEKESGAASKPGGAPVAGETRGVRAPGENRESPSLRESAQTAEQAASKPELARGTHVDESIDAAFEQHKVDFRRGGINKITETNEPFGATGFREKPDGTRELLVNRKIAREWFDKFGPEKARQLISKGFEEEAKHAIERKVARDNGTDTAALYRDWAKQNPDQEKILASAYGKGWANYSDTGKSAELARMILQTRASGKTTEQLHLGPERAAAIEKALKQFKEPVRLTERLRQHLTNVLEYLRRIKNPSKAILDHIKEVEKIASASPSAARTLSMAKPRPIADDANLRPAELFRKHSLMADSIARGYANIPGVDAMDVQQHARIALARAAKAFDPSRGSSLARAITFEGKQPKDYERSSTQVTLSKEEAKPFIDFGKTIPKSEIFTDPDDPTVGLEDEPHVTALYGITQSSPTDTAKTVLEHSPGGIAATVGKLSMFKTPKYDVLKADIDSPQLHEINAALRASVPFESDFPDYKPHLTIAYLKHGEAAKYVGDDRFEGARLAFSKLDFRSRDGSKFGINLASGEDQDFAAFAKRTIRNELNGLYRDQSKKAVEQTTLDEPLSRDTSETQASQLPDEAGRSPSDNAAHNEGIKVLHEAIDALPAKMRTVMTRLAAGDDPGAIARDLDIAKQGVSNLKIAALRRLRGKLGEHGITGIDDDGIVRMAKPEPSEISVPTGETPEEKRTFRRAATRLVPGLNVARDIKSGIQSLLLPTAQSPEHVRAAVDLGRPLGEMHHRQEVSAYQLKPDWKAFEKLGVHREDVPLTENAGIKFMSDMSQGRKMTDPALQSVADRIDAMFIERLDHLEKAGAPLESVRENYFPGMWTRESREAFNQAMGEFREAGKLPDNFDVNEAPAELKAAIKARADHLLESGQGSAKDMLSYLVRTPMKGRESFRKGKVFDDVMTAVEFGLRPISNNPADLVMGKLAEMDKSIMANQAFRTWEKKGQLVAFDNSGRPMKQELRRNFNRDEWTQINDKYGTIWHRNEETGMLEKVGERWATKPVADIVNNYLSSSLYNNRYFGKLYTGWMATANALNQSQLGWGSAFHAGFTTMEAQVSAGANLLKDVYSVMRGTRSFGDLARTAKDYPTAFAKTAITGDKVLNAWRNPDGVIDPRIAQIVRATELAGAGFKLERGMKTEQSAKVVSDWFSGNKVRAAMRSPIAFTELLAKPIMEQLVPRQKAGVFAHLAWRIIEQNPGKAIEDLAPEFRDAWNRVDARLGQVRYDRLFANNTAKNVVQALVRAPGWTGGTIAELGGAFKDAGTFVKEWHQTGSLPKDIPDRVAYSLSLLVTAAAMNGALTYALTGTAPQGKDFLAFRDGGVDEAGNPTRMILPSYMKDVWAYATHPMDTLLHKSHPLLSIFGDLIQNKDYYGVQVRDPEANALTQALQSGLHVVKAFTPFWIRGVMQGKTPTAKALPLVGVMPAPKSMTATPAQELAYELHKRQYEGLTKTHAEAEKTKLHSELIKSARSGDTLSVRQAVIDGKITRSEAQRLLADARLTPFQSTVHKLPLKQALSVFGKGTESEKEELRPVLQKRNEESHKRGDLPADEYFENKAKLAGSTTPQAARTVLHSKPVMPRPPAMTGLKKVSEVNLIRQWKRAA